MNKVMNLDFHKWIELLVINKQVRNWEGKVCSGLLCFRQRGGGGGGPL